MFSLQSVGPWELSSYIVNLFFMVVFITKGSLLVFLQIWVRWTFPRLRIDQVMMTCLKYLLPISCALFLGATLWPLAVYQIKGGNAGEGRTQFMGKPLADKVNRNEVTAVQSRADKPLLAADEGGR